MAYASKSGRARTSAKSPQAHAICERCGFRWNFVDLQWQFEWQGAALINQRLLVCERCLDVPQEQLRAIILPQDPVPITYARPEYFADYSTDWLSAAPPTYDPVSGIQYPLQYVIGTVDGGPELSTQPIGPPVGLSPDAQMALVNVVKQHQPVPYLSIVSAANAGNVSSTVTVTCSSAHGLSTNSQIAVLGLSNVLANGFYSVTVTNTMVFTYQTNSFVTAGSLVAAHTEMVTVNVGLPRNYVVLPQVGPIVSNNS